MLDWLLDIEWVQESMEIMPVEWTPRGWDASAYLVNKWDRFYAHGATLPEALARLVVAVAEREKEAT